MSRVYGAFLFCSALLFIWLPQYRSQCFWTVFVCLVAAGLSVAFSPDEVEDGPETIYSKGVEDVGAE